MFDEDQIAAPGRVRAHEFFVDSFGESSRRAVAIQPQPAVLVDHHGVRGRMRSVPAGLVTGHVAPMAYALAPLWAVATCFASHWLWRRAVSNYTSAGG